MITPEAFQLAERSGRGLDRTPTTAELAVMLKPQGEGRVCLSDPGAGSEACQLVFENQAGTWKLVAMRAGELQSQPRPAAG